MRRAEVSVSTDGSTDRVVTAASDDVSGTTLDGVFVTDLEVLDLVRTAGSLTIVRGPALRLRRAAWAEQFGLLAHARGVRTSIRDTGRLVVILDLDRAELVPPPDIGDHDDASASRAAHPSAGAWLRGVPNL